MTSPPADFRARGSRHGASKLTEADVRAIRQRFFDGGETFRVLADAFGVSPQTISLILHRRTWRHVE